MAIGNSICVDFDGVIHRYENNDYPAISSNPTPGAFEFLRSAVRHFDKVYIFSTRNWEPDGAQEMRTWMLKHGLEAAVVRKLAFPREKPPVILYIDDRGFQFTGTFPSIEYIKNFQPWNRQ